MNDSACLSFTDAETLAFIKARVKLDYLFSGKRNAVESGWEQVVKESGLAEKATAIQASEKWDDLKTKYEDLKDLPIGTGTDSGEATAATWPWFVAMDEALGERPSMKPPTLIASCSVPNHGQTAAEASPSPHEPSHDQKDSMTSTSSRPPRKRCKRDERILAFLKAQAEKEEAMDAAFYAQNERFLALLSKRVNNNKTP